MLVDRLAAVAVPVSIAVPVVVAVLLLAARATVRRGGRVEWRRSVLVGSAALYAVALTAVVLLPLPEAGYCIDGGAPTQLVPLQFVADAVREQRGTGMVAVAANPAVQGVVANVALLVPMGALVAIVGRSPRGPRPPGRLRSAGALGAGVSLVIETTQLTGVWGLLPCAHRIFDVDDLITNTGGALLGALLAPVVVRAVVAVVGPVTADHPGRSAPGVAVRPGGTGSGWDTPVASAPGDGVAREPGRDRGHGPDGGREGVPVGSGARSS